MEIDKNELVKYFNKRDVVSNKKDYGKIGIIGGSTEYSGALKLSYLSSSSYLSGAGIVRVITFNEVIPFLGDYILEETLYPLEDDLSNIDDALKGLDVVVLGMGLGISDKTRKLIREVLKKYSGKLIIDADGLNILSEDLSILDGHKCNIILTPHKGELMRLCNCTEENIDYSLVDKFASKYKVIVVYKGHTTYVTDGTEAYTVTCGGAGMATAGSGDVLSGIIGGMQGLLDYGVKEVCASVYLNGLAGSLAEEKYTDISMRARNTIEFIPSAIKIVRGEE